MSIYIFGTFFCVGSMWVFCKMNNDEVHMKFMFGMHHLIFDQHQLWPGLELHTVDSRVRPRMRDALMVQEINICL